MGFKRIGIPIVNRSPGAVVNLKLGPKYHKKRLYWSKFQLKVNHFSGVLLKFDAMDVSLKYKVSISISFVLALLFVLPWFSLFGDQGPLTGQIDPHAVRDRLLFLWTSTFLGGLLYFQFNFFWKRYILWMGSPWSRIFLVGMVNLGLIVCYSMLLTVVVSLIFGVQAQKGFFLIYVLRNIVVALICTLVVYAFEKTRHSKNAQMELMRLGHERTEMELAMLKYQLDPHFLFNCMNTLSGLVRQDKREALLFLEHFSETFRYTLETTHDHLVRVEEEMDFVKSYLYLLELRFSEGLQVKSDILERDLQRKLPQFAIQLLVENAVKHNVVSRDWPLQVSISSNGETLTVCNTLQPKQPSRANFGIGLANLWKRYELLGHRSVDIAITETHFEVKLQLL